MNSTRWAGVLLALIGLGGAGERPHADGLRAGVGRADITPPPVGIGLAGNGPEGKEAAGYRVRLYVRALVLEDAEGNAVALAVADLPHVSQNLHWLTAQRVARETGLTPDRIIISATHTHAAPGHFYAESNYNEFGSSVPGYDTAVVNFLVERFASAIIDAWHTRRPARAAWGRMPVWGHTRNRSYEAFLLNKPEWTPPYPVPAGLDPVHRAVDPVWTMLRVDVQDGADPDRYIPLGAYSIFAIHGTGNATENDLFDADIHGMVERGLERHIDSLNGRPPGFRNQAVHVFANGTEGDVSPDWPANARCGIPRIQPDLDPGGPRTPGGPWGWAHPDPVRVALCLRAARTYIEAVGDSLSRRAAGLFDALGADLKNDLPVRVAFGTLALRDDPRLCGRAFTGVSTLAGAEDGETRWRGWRLFGLIPIGLEEGGSAVNPHPSGCQREKRIVFRALQELLTPADALPTHARLAVVRIGSQVLAAVPAEVTTVAGYQMKRAVGARLTETGPGTAPPVAVIGLANGFMQYVTTDAEYSAQHYEGGSDLYGPRTAEVLAAELADLAGRLASGSTSPVAAIPGHPGKPRKMMGRA
ncbi:MAG: neutral/alkaline non-lysosomal ceramidase N-terminal domain-containing protein, partial [Gemmatimonadales bacterium]